MTTNTKTDYTLVIVIFVLMICCSLIASIALFFVFNSSPLRGRYIRIKRSTVGCLHVAQIKVYSKASGDNILTSKTPVTASSLIKGSNLNNIVDALDTTHTHTDCTDIGWIEIDLEKNTDIHRIVLTNRKDCCKGRINGVKIEILDSSKKSIYTSDAIKDQDNSTTSVEGNDRAYTSYEILPPNKKVNGTV